MILAPRPAARRRFDLERYRQPNRLRRFDQSAFMSDRNCLRSTESVQLFQNRFYVVLYRVFADVELLSNLFVAFTERHLVEDLKLTLG